MNKKIIGKVLGLALAVSFISATVYAQGNALTQVATRISSDATGARSATETACRALCVIFILVGIVRAAWKSNSDNQDGGKAWGGWVLTSILIGIAFGLVSVVI